MASFCYVGVLNINWKAVGWSEKYFLGTAPTGDLAGLQDKLKQIAFGRTAFFGLGCELVNARLSLTDPTHDGYRIPIAYPLGPHKSWLSTPGNLGDSLGPINDPTVVSQLRFQTAEGKFWQRYMHCIPDAWVSGKALADPNVLLPYFMPAGATAPVQDMTNDGNGTHLQICQWFWQYLISNSKGGHLVTKGVYELLDPKLVLYAQITKKNVGRPFGTPRGRRQKTLITLAP